MPSELDRKFDAVLAAVTGPGGRLIIERGRAGPRDRRQFPGDAADCSSSTFCALNAEVEAVVAGDERLTFADLDAIVGPAGAWRSSRAASRKGDRVGIAMRNCPAWIVSYMASLKAGGVATLLNGWWQPTSWSMRST